LRAAVDALKDEELAPDYNMAPTKPAPVVVARLPRTPARMRHRVSLGSPVNKL
jgi:putative SOS response-associated peptidase YedK